MSKVKLKYAHFYFAYRNKLELHYHVEPHQNFHFVGNFLVRSKVNCHHNLTTSIVNHGRYLYQMTQIYDELFSSFCMDRHTNMDRCRQKQYPILPCRVSVLLLLLFLLIFKNNNYNKATVSNQCSKFDGQL